MQSEPQPSPAAEAVLQYPFAQAPEPGRLLEVAPGVAWLCMPLPFVLQHINLWLLDDGPGLCIVDTGLGDLASREIWEALLSELARPVSRIIATHYHPDHLGNAAWLARHTGAPVSMTQGEFLVAHEIFRGDGLFSVAAMVAHFRRHGLDEARCEGLLERGNPYPRGVPELPPQCERLAEGDRLQIGAHRWEVITGRGHSPEHASLWCAELNLLIAGDMLLPRISSNVSPALGAPDEDAVGRFVDSLTRLCALPEDCLVLPAHGLPFRGVQQRVTQLKTHHEERCDDLLQALAVPAAAGALLPVLFRRPLDKHQTMFAMNELLAHLNHLHARQRVRKVEDAGLIRYERQDRPTGGDPYDGT